MPLSRALNLTLATLSLSLEVNPSILPVRTCSPSPRAVRPETYENSELGWAAVASPREGAQGAHRSVASFAVG